ncbi:hypothetical protein [Burkholderia multivorans]|uniref:hypothetical protein n=1 Tax=Burkholderia multivorans TaxID=87883 RepID=UPI0021C1E49D|nr:hypothetical protein [Burkholderia multivorans]
MIFIDCFSVGLDDLPKKKQGNIAEVLRVLQKCGRFSCFEASANSTIAATMTTIYQGGYIETKDLGYPWTKVKLTAKGLATIAPASEGDRLPCPQGGCPFKIARTGETSTICPADHCAMLIVAKESES